MRDALVRLFADPELCARFGEAGRRRARDVFSVDRFTRELSVHRRSRAAGAHGDDAVLILGFNAYHGDVAAALLDDGRIVAAIEEERFCRIKHVAGFPAAAMQACLKMAGATAAGRRRVRRGTREAGAPLAEDPLRADASAAAAPCAAARGVAQPRPRGSPADARDARCSIPEDRAQARLRYVEHHPAHLASAFFASGFADATCCAIDGFGDFVSVSVADGRGTTLDVVHRVFFPHSLGLLYLAVTQFLGFKNWGDEYKVMGLGPVRAAHGTRTRFADC